jgi:hypothetical protein
MSAAALRPSSSSTLPRWVLGPCILLELLGSCIPRGSCILSARWDAGRWRWASRGCQRMCKSTGSPIAAYCLCVLPVFPVPQVYRFFMTGDDSKCEEVDGRQAAEFEARAAGIQADTQRLQAVSACGRVCVRAH